MNQEKIGKFILECRKSKKLTQEQLAEKIGVTSKSISRWENGNTMPDYSLLESICKELNVSVNELLTGEKLNQNEYKENAEINLIKLRKKIDDEIKWLKILSYIASFTFLIMFIIRCYINIKNKLNPDVIMFKNMSSQLMLIIITVEIIIYSLKKIIK